MFASCNSEKLLPRQDFGTQNHFTFSKRAHPVTLILLEPEKRKKTSELLRIWDDAKEKNKHPSYCVGVLVVVSWS